MPTSDRFAGLVFENQLTPAEPEPPKKKRRKLTREERAKLLAQDEADLKLIDAGREPGEEPLWPPKPGTNADLAGMLDEDEDDYDGDDVAAQIREDEREIAEEKARAALWCQDCDRGGLIPDGQDRCKRHGVYKLEPAAEVCLACGHKHRGETRETRQDECGYPYPAIGNSYGWCICSSEHGHGRSPWTNGTLGDGRRRR